MSQSCERSRSKWLLCLSVASVLVACGAVEPMPDLPPDAAIPSVDSVAPRVVSSTPAPSAIGVAADDVIVIEFSEAMDSRSVVAAYQSTDLPLSDVAVRWDARSERMTLSPMSPLAYAVGVGGDPSTVTARTYTLTIGAGATDVAGNPLEAPYTLVFSTKKRMRTTAPTVGDMTRVARAGVLLSEANPMWMGDNGSNETYQSFLTFDLQRVPLGFEIESAQIEGQQQAPTGVPYSMGAVMTDHITYAAVAQAPASLPLATVGPWSTDATLEAKQITVTDAVRDDAAQRQARGYRSQFRLRFEQPSNRNGNVDVAVFAKTSFALSIVYLAD